MIMTFLVMYCMNTANEFKGVVSDVDSSERLTGVMVVANKTDTTYTDFDGNFKFKNDSIASLEFKYPSYENFNYILIPDTTDLQIVSSDKN